MEEREFLYRFYDGINELTHLLVRFISNMAEQGCCIMSNRAFSEN